MNNKSRIVALIAISILTSCDKKEEPVITYVSGQVNEMNGDREIAGAIVCLIENEYHSINTFETFLDSIQSDSNGHYSFQFDYSRGYYKVAAYHKDYFTNNLNGNLQHNIFFGKNQTIDLELWPHAWLSIRFINTGIYSSVNVNRLFGESNGYIVSSDDSTIVGLVQGNTQTEINYFLYPGGAHKVKEVYCQGLDTTYIEIRF